MINSENGRDCRSFSQENKYSPLSSALPTWRTGFFIEVIMGLYIIGNNSQKICKIGVSDNPQKRLKSIQTGCPYKVNILSHYPELGYDTEKDLHKRFKKYRMQGEWFRIKGEVEKLIHDNPFKEKNKKKIKPPKKVKTIPPISYKEQRKLSRPKRKRKNQSGYLSRFYNHK